MGDKGGPTVIGTQPGQVVVKREDVASEVRIPWQQIWHLMKCNFAIYAAVTGCLVLAREWLLAVAGLAMGLVLCWQVWRRLRNWFIVGILASIVVSLSLVVGGPLARRAWHLMLTEYRIAVLQVWGIGLLIVVVIYPMVIGTYRYTGEIVDPGGPTSPRMAVAWPGTIWPWQVDKIFRALNPPKETREPESVVTERVQAEVMYRERNAVVGMERIDLLTGLDAGRRMREVAKMVVAGRPISEGELAGPGHPLAAGTEFRGFQDNLLERGLVVWKRPGAPTQGVILTAVGRQVFKRLAMGNGVGESAPPHQEDA